jgi:hypothetical protein
MIRSPNKGGGQGAETWELKKPRICHITRLSSHLIVFQTCPHLSIAIVSFQGSPNKFFIMAKSSARYNFFRPELRDVSYEIGDVYSEEEVKKAQAQWEIITYVPLPISSNPNYLLRPAIDAKSRNTEKKEYPYLSHVKLLSNTWPHLRLLADFMEVGTTPLRWKDLNEKEEKKDKKAQTEAAEARNERATRCNVTRLDFVSDGQVTKKACDSSMKLLEALKDDEGESSQGKRELRLFVVEDLSRDVIEALGSELDIEPAFFREHIFDYAWYNIRDRWQDPPNLRSATRKRRWVQLRYVTARYFKTQESFKKGVKEAEKFNVLRRPDDDMNNKAVWDDEGAIVGIMRSRASFWLRQGDEKRGPVGRCIQIAYGHVICSELTCFSGVLLLDPTIKEGQTLWYGYRNWQATPPVGTKSSDYPTAPERKTLFNDFIYWVTQKDHSNPPSTTQTTASQPTTESEPRTHLPIRTLLHLICGEWLTIADYIRTRIGQIEWEVSNPAHFLTKENGIEDALNKLHVWRRLVPLYREMLKDSLQRVFEFPYQSPAITNNGDEEGRKAGKEAKESSILAFKEDFEDVLEKIEVCQQRIDRLTSVVTAIISIEDSRRSQQDNQNVARLTWLATFFIPLSYVASLFSMQVQVGMEGTYRQYFKISIPVAVASLLLAWILTLPEFQKHVMVNWNKMKKD